MAISLGVRFSSSSSVSFRPACAQPIILTALATPFFESQPLFSSSAIDQISANTAGGSFVPSNTFTAASPVTTPSFWGSACWNTWWTRVVSAGVGAKFEDGMCESWGLVDVRYLGSTVVGVEGLSGLGVGGRGIRDGCGGGRGGVSLTLARYVLSIRTREPRAVPLFPRCLVRRDRCSASQ